MRYPHPIVIVKCRDITQRTSQQNAIALSQKLAIVGELTAGLAHNKGAGLGLAIARRLIHKHAGDISVHSTAGVGSIVVISLPVEADNSFTMKEETYGHGNHSAR